jgi:hypothetical protein
MARTSRMVINRKVYSEVVLAVADGVFEVLKTMIEATRPPDAPPFTEGLVDNGGALVYVNGKKVAGFGLDGKQPRPPRAAKVSRGQGILGYAGWGPPARFNELGTVKQPARPFFTPTAAAISPQATRIMAPVVKGKLPRRG